MGWGSGKSVQTTLCVKKSICESSLRFPKLQIFVFIPFGSGVNTITLQTRKHGGRVMSGLGEEGVLGSSCWILVVKLAWHYID